MSRPRPMMITSSAVSGHLAHQVARDEDRPALAGEALQKLRTQRMPSGSSPLTGSSKSRTPGSPSSAAAIPRRWPIPRENLPAR